MYNPSSSRCVSSSSIRYANAKTAALKAAECREKKESEAVSDAVDLVLRNSLKDGTPERTGIVGQLSRKISNHFFADQMALLGRLSPKAKARPLFNFAPPNCFLLLLLSQPCTSRNACRGLFIPKTRICRPFAFVVRVIPASRCTLHRPTQRQIPCPIARTLWL